MSESSEIVKQLQAMGQQAVDAAKVLSNASDENKAQALLVAASEIRANQDRLIEANARDMDFGRSKGKSSALLDRLMLDQSRIEDMAAGLEAIAGLPDPVGQVMAEWSRPSGLQIKRVRTPLGVIGVIFESRPNVTADAGALCVKAGNAVILRCGSESIHSSMTIADCLRSGCEEAGLPEASIQLVPTRDRAAVGEMLRMSQYIDVIVPRGGRSLVERVQSEARVPVFAHLEGICHVYVDAHADIEKANRVVMNAKTRRPGICGAAECLLVDRKFWNESGAPFIDSLIEAGVEVRADDELRAIAGTVPATSEDFGHEFLDMIMAAKVVDGIEGAINHIQKHGSQHTDAIITECDTTADRFFSELDSAILMRNASTQFADGGEFGLGGEIGIATGKLHARGPIGTEQLTSFKYVVVGDGTVRP